MNGELFNRKHRPSVLTRTLAGHRVSELVHDRGTKLSIETGEIVCVWSPKAN